MAALANLDNARLRILVMAERDPLMAFSAQVRTSSLSDQDGRLRGVLIAKHFA